ncbi:MAG: hypothetical protein HRT44_09480 [Bdellovibrionales bacterium]|nr:phospholipase D-like domain-containing protein [Bdellovibrionales bacterium]NQZ19471.1 hypothetical protein [Bdellovibrionales bacterium]
MANPPSDIWSRNRHYYTDTPFLGSSLNNIKNDCQRTSSPQWDFPPIMHNKYVVFSDEEVWTGSANFSETGLGIGYNANVSMSIQSKELAQAFQSDFKKMYEDLTFNNKPRAQQFRLVDGIEVTLIFSPSRSVRPNILRLINSA